jgi:hypothetical protein
VLGRAVWDAFANNLGTVPVPIVPALAAGGDRARDPHSRQPAGGGTGVGGKTVPAATAPAGPVRALSAFSSCRSS